MEYTIKSEHLAQYRAYLLREERAKNTIDKYMHDVTEFYTWLQGRAVTRETVNEWKSYLLAGKLTAGTVNTKLAALHCLFDCLAWPEMKVKYLKVQRRVFRDVSKDMSRAEFDRLITAALASGKGRLALVIETICATGIRVSELRYLTVEAAQLGRSEICMKGKIRTILIPAKLARKLLKYARKQKIASGEIFITKSGTSLSRRQIWGEMKALCKAAGVDSSKVFPHNLRHLFARTFYNAYRDIVRLADVLGHSSVETTRIYLITTGHEFARQLDSLGLVS